ncbi:MAG: MFS transporter, partial [Pseudomonadota bacterium]
PRGEQLSARGALHLHAELYRSPFKNAAGLGWLFYTFCFVTTVTFLPAFIREDIRVAVAAAMPIVSIVASMTVGVVLISLVGAVRGTQIAFAFAGLMAAALIWFPGQVTLALLLLAGLGIIQGASFAIVPELNASLEDRAQANGAMAQMGNVGNAVGTPVIAALLSGMGYGAMIVALSFALFCGVAVHIWMAARRRRLPEARAAP